MGFKKGNKEGLKGGRKAGQRNSPSIRNFSNLMASFIDRNFDSLQDKFDLLTPKEQFDVLFKMMKYTTPEIEKVPMTPKTQEEKQPQIIQIGETTISFS